MSGPPVEMHLNNGAKPIADPLYWQEKYIPTCIGCYQAGAPREARWLVPWWLFACTMRYTTTSAVTISGTMGFTHAKKVSYL